MPRPSSRTSTVRAPPGSRARVIAQRVAPACFTTSRATRRRSGTPPPRPPREARSRRRRPRSPRARTAPARPAARSAASRPRSSSAGGRRSWTRRRTSSSASRTSVRASRTSSRARSGSDSTALPAASSRIATPPSAGPSPSCRSRRIRRRSSSRPSTSRSRLSWTSAASRLLRIAIAAWRTRSTSSPWSRRDSIERTPDRGQHQPTDALSGVGDVDLRAPAGSAPVAGRHGATVGCVQLDPDEGHLERRRDGTGERRQLLVDGAGLLEPGRERRHHVVPVAAPPEQHPAYGGAHPRAQRAVDPHGQHQHHQRHVAFVETVAQQGTAHGQDEQVEGDHQSGHPGVGERPGDQGVHVREVGADHPDRDRDRGEHHGGRQHDAGDRARGRHDQHRNGQHADDPGPEEPAQLGALQAVRAAVPGEGDHQRAEKGQRG